MSLQLLNDDFQVKLEEKDAPKNNPLRRAVRRIRPVGIGGLMRGQYPTSQRLEELLLDFE